MPFGLGDYVAGVVRPHLIYYRQQGILLAVAAVFGAAALLFVVLAIFLALTYLMAPLWAAILCAVLCALVVAVMLMMVQRRARLRARAGAEVMAAEEKSEEAVKAARLRAAAGIAGVLLPAIAIGAAAFLLGRKSDS